MNPVLIVVLIVAVLMVVAVFFWKTTSERKARETYSPPVANNIVTHSDVPVEVLPARSAEHLCFCQKCGSPNSDQSSNCTKCGAKL